MHMHSQAITEYTIDGDLGVTGCARTIGTSGERAEAATVELYALHMPEEAKLQVPSASCKLHVYVKCMRGMCCGHG